MSLACLPSIPVCAAKISAPGTVEFVMSGASNSGESESMTSDGGSLPPSLQLQAQERHGFPDLVPIWLPAHTQLRRSIPDTQAITEQKLRLL
jgi:hypothetical protein